MEALRDSTSHWKRTLQYCTSLNTTITVVSGLTLQPLHPLQDHTDPPTAVATEAAGLLPLAELLTRIPSSSSETQAWFRKGSLPQRPTITPRSDPCENRLWLSSQLGASWVFSLDVIRLGFLPLGSSWAAQSLDSHAASKPRMSRWEPNSFPSLSLVVCLMRNTP